MSINKNLINEINKNFEALSIAVECVIDPSNPVKSVTVTGASGVGKSYNIIKRLEEADAAGECSYNVINGKCTKLELYKAFYNAREKGSVLLLDDVDVFDEEDKLNLLKAALEMRDERLVTYASSANSLRKESIPTQFLFEGKIIFITNKNLEEIVTKGGSLAPHVEALMDRGLFINLGLFDNESIMAHVYNIMTTTNILEKFDMSDMDAIIILNFMIKHCESLRRISLRLPTQIAGIYKNHNNWEEICLSLFTK